MLLISSDVASLEVLLSRWELAEYASEAFVILGCAGEYIAEHTKVREKEWSHKLSGISLAVLTIALTFGLIALARTNSLSGREVALLNGIAADAQRKVDEAVERTRKLEVSNKQLSIDLEVEKQKTARFQKEADEARFTLENRVRTQGPRYFLLRSAAPKLTTELSKFSGQRVALLICGMYRTERETLETWGSLANILGPDTVNGVKGAGWKLVRGNPIWDKCGLSMQGISVIVSPESPKTTRDAAEALSVALQRTLPPYNGNPWVLDPAWTRHKMAGGIVLDKDDPERLALENPGMIVVFIGEHPPM